MSGTPKKTIAVLNDEIKKRLARDHSRAENQRLSLWHQITDRMQVGAFKNEIYNGHLQIVTRTVKENEALVHPAAFQRLQAKCERIESSSSADKSVEQLLKDVEELDEIRNELMREIARKNSDDSLLEAAKGEEEKSRRGALANRLNAVTAVFQIQSKTDTEQEDTTRCRVQEALARGSGVLVQEDRTLAEIEGLVAQAEMEVTRYQERLHDNEIRSREVLVDVGNMEAMVAALAKHPAVHRWCPESIRELLELVKQARAAASSNDTRVTSVLSVSLRRNIDTIVKGAEAKQEEREKRQFLTEQVTQSLAEVGYQIRGVRYEETADPTADIHIIALQPNGRQINLDIKDEGVIEILPDKREIQVEQENGSTITTCDTLVEDLNKAKSRLVGRGVQTSELEWEDKPANARRSSRDGEQHKDDQKVQRQKRSKGS